MSGSVRALSAQHVRTEWGGELDGNSCLGPAARRRRRGDRGRSSSAPGLEAIRRYRRRDVAGATLVACGGSSSSTGTTAANSGGSINPHGILKYGVDLNDEFDNTFNPEMSLNPCGYAILSNIYASGLGITNTAFLPNVIQSWSSTNNTVTLHVRPGVVFSNGDPVTAETIKDSITYMKPNPLLTTLTAISSMDVTGQYTLVLNLSNPIPGDVIQALYHTDGTIIDPSTTATDATKPIGAGPFVLQSYQQGSSINLVANPRYWNKSAYKLGGVSFIQVGLGPQTIGALESGAVDMATLEPDDVSAVRSGPQPRGGGREVLRLRRPPDAPEQGTFHEPQGPCRARVRG